MTTTPVLRRRSGAILLALSAAVVLATLFAARANAAFTINGFTVSASTVQAAGHPKLTATIDPDPTKASNSNDALRDITIDAPAGLQLNQAAATSKCTDTQLAGSTCPSQSYVGTITVKFRNSFGSTITTAGNVYVMTTPATPNSAALGFLLKATGYKNVAARVNVSDAVPASKPSRFQILGIPRTIQNSLGLSVSVWLDQISVVLNAKSNSSQSGPYFTLNPSACAINTSTATLTSYGNTNVTKSSSFTTTGCGAVPFNPTATVAPSVTTVGQPTGLNAAFTVPTADATIQNSTVKSIQITSPKGASLNLPAINAVPALCTDAALLTDTCSAGSKIGTSSFSFPPALPAWSGDLYLLDRNAGSFRIGAVSRGTNGAFTTARGTASALDSDGDSVADSVRLTLDQLPGAAWSSATLNISSQLLVNGCSPGSSTTILQGANGAAATRSASWGFGDCAPPETQITSPPAANSSNRSPSITFVSIPSGASFFCQWDSAVFSPCASPAAPPAPLADGPHQFCVRAVANGQTDPSPACASFIVDTTPPTAQIVDVSSTGASATVSFTSEAGSTTTCRLDGGTPVACTSPWNLTGLASGTHTVTVCATDAAGNAGCASASWETAPLTVTITQAPPALTTSSTATFAFVASRTPATFACSFDNGPSAGCASPTTYTGYAFGSHNFCVRATDSGGNVSTNTACYTFTFGEPPPPMTITRTNPTADPTSSASQVLTVNNVPADSTLHGSLDGGTAAVVTSPITLTGLSDGSHSYAVYASSNATGEVSPAASVTWTVDRTPPVVTITSPLPGIVGGTSVQLVFTVTDASQIVSVTCSFDGAVPSACTSPTTYTGLTNGTHTIQVCATDAAGNKSCSSVSIQPPGPPPSTTITSGPSGSVSSSSASFSFTATDPVAAFECQLDNGAWATCSSPRLYSGLTEGGHTFCVRAVDLYGNIGPSTCRSWIVDTIGPAAPVVSRTSPTSNPTNSPAQTIVFSGAEAGGSFQASKDGGAFASAISPVSLSGLADGTHTYAVRQIDAAGNVGSVSTVTWFVDTVPPPAPVVTGPSSPSTQTSVTITFTDAEPAVTCQGSRDGGAFSTVTSPVSLSGITDGVHTYAVRCVDAAGNISPTTTVSWSASIEPPPPPTLIRVSPTTSPSSSTSATFDLLNLPSGYTAQGSLDFAAYTSRTFPITFSGLANGSHTFSVRVVDQTGGVSGSVSNTWIVDTVPPPALTVTLVSPTTPVTQSTTATIAYSGVEAGATVKGSLDGAAFSNAPASPVNLTGLGLGSHSYSLIQVDAAGNASSASSVAWTIGIGPLAPTINSGPSGATTSNSASFTFSGADAGSIYQCQLDGGPWMNCVSPITFASLQDGTHTFCVRIVDQYGSTTAATCQSWTVDTTPPPPPVLTRISPSSSPTTQTSATFAFSDPEVGVTFEASRDGGAFAFVTSPAQITGLADGVHTYSVRAKDAVGNLSPAVSNSWTVSTIPPPPPFITSGPSGAVASLSASFTFSGADPGSIYQCQLDNGPWTPCTSPVAYNSLNQGAHIFCVRIIDAAGNVGSAVCRAWTVDTIGPPPPTVTLTSPTSSPTTQTTATVTFSSTEAGVTFQGSLDGSAFATAASPVSLSGLVEGTHTYSVRAIDAVGNIGPAWSVSWTIQTPPPVNNVSIDSGPVSIVNSADATFTFSATVAGSTFKCSIDSAAEADCASPATYNSLGEGTHTFCVRALSGGQSTAAACRTWVIDTLPPVISIASPADGSTTANGAVTLNYSATDANGTPSCSPAKNTNIALAIGANPITVTCTDSIGNVSSSTATVTRVEAQPVVTITTPQNNLKTTDTFVIVHFTVSPSGLSCNMTDGAAQQLALGTNTITVTCTSGSLSGSASVSVQRANPLTLYPGCSMGGATYTQLSCFPQATGGFPPYTYTCRIDGGPAVSCSQYLSYPLALGGHTITICVTDSTGATVCSTLTVISGSSGGGGGGTTCPPGMICLPSDPNAPQ